ncbi:MAG: ribosome maturation factor RimM [Firmicutes bacterium]|nr:ribosome maturation factor RimM [Bacillota bacterium]
MKDNFLDVAKILKPVGLKGEVKIKCFLDSIDYLSDIKSLYLEPCDKSEFLSAKVKQKSGTHSKGGIQFIPLKIVKLRKKDNEFGFVYLEGVTGVQQAEALRDKPLYAIKDEIPLGENRYFIADLLGCIVYDSSGKVIGEVADIDNFGAADVYTIVSGDKQFMFPLADHIIVSIDPTKKEIVLTNEVYNMLVE